MSVEIFNDREIEVVTFEDIGGECETLEFHGIDGEGLRFFVAVSQPDSNPSGLRLSVDGVVDLDFAEWAISHTRRRFAV